MEAKEKANTLEKLLEASKRKPYPLGQRIIPALSVEECEKYLRKFSFAKSVIKVNGEVVGEIARVEPKEDVLPDESNNIYKRKVDPPNDFSKEKMVWSHKVPKTKKCDWCEKRRKVEDMYHLGKMPKSEIDYWICSDCNLKEDVI